MIKLKDVHDYVLSNGGKRYLSGWMGMMQTDGWKQQWGAKFTNWTAQKDKLDPKHIFQSKLFEETLEF